MLFSPFYFKGLSGGFQVVNSLRFPGFGSYLTLNQNQGNQKTCTYSVWFKKCFSGNMTQGTGPGYFELLATAGVPSDRTGLRIEDDRMELDETAGNSQTMLLKSSAYYRDPAAWYHMMWTLDTTQATNTDRFKFYVNGVEQTISGSYLGQNSDLRIGAAGVPFTIGWLSTSTNPRDSIDGYLSQVYFIDGEVLPPTTFGAYNDDGVWVPIKAEIEDYGVNGFNLKFEDKNNPGLDSSPNHNDLVATGFDSGGQDSVTDSPTGNFATLNPNQPFTAPQNTNQDQMLKGCMGANNSDTTYKSNLSTIALVPGGKFYWEMRCESDIGSATVFAGMSAADTDIGNTSTGLWGVRINSSGAIPIDNGADNKTFTAIPVNGDVVSWTYDGTDPNDIKIANYLNGVVQRTIHSTGLPDVQNPLFCNVRTSGTYNFTMNWGQEAWAYGPPDASYLPLQTLSLPAAAVLNGQNAHRTLTGAGSGILTAAQTAFPYGLWWIKDMDNANQHQLVDSMSAGQALTCPSISPPKANYVAPSGQSVAWCWGVDNNQTQNNNGSQVSTTMTNVAAGFSIIEYTGTGSNGTTIGHGLNAPPQFMLAKTLDSNSENWIVYAFSNSFFTRLNTSGPQTGSGTLFEDVTDTVIQLGDNTSFNGAGSTNRIYAWAAVPGYSAFGRYMGNGNDSGAFVYTGFRVAWLMVKRVDGDNSWWVVDSTRDPTNPVKQNLYPNLTAEQGPFSRCDFLSNGIKILYQSVLSNAAGSEYLWAAFAENPFGGNNVSPANAR